MPFEWVTSAELGKSSDGVAILILLDKHADMVQVSDIRPHLVPSAPIIIAQGSQKEHRGKSCVSCSMLILK